MAQLRREVDQIHAHGAELVVIGNGTSQFARAFRDDLQLDTPLYVDSSCGSYRALGMERGVARTLGSWRTWAHHFRALRDGIRERRAKVIVRWWGQSATALLPGGQGDAWQLGGVIVVLPDGRMPYRHKSAIAGEHPPATDILAALGACARSA